MTPIVYMGTHTQQGHDVLTPPTKHLYALAGHISNGARRPGSNPWQTTAPEDAVDAAGSDRSGAGTCVVVVRTDRTAGVRSVVAGGVPPRGPPGRVAGVTWDGGWNVWTAVRGSCAADTPGGLSRDDRPSSILLPPIRGSADNDSHQSGPRLGPRCRPHPVPEAGNTRGCSVGLGAGLAIAGSGRLPGMVGGRFSDRSAAIAASGGNW